MTGRSTSHCSRLLCLTALVGAVGTLLVGCGPRAVGDVAPPATEAAVIHAQGLLRLGDPAAAERVAQAVIDEHPDHVWAHRVAQDALLAQGKRDHAVEVCLGRAAEHPDEAVHAYLAGRILLPDREAARPYFEAAVELEPHWAWGHVGLAQLEVLEGDMYQAIRIHDQQLEQQPDNADLQMSLGFLTLQIRLLRDAKHAFRRALAERPWDPRILGGLGQTLGQLGNETEAVEMLELALAHDPSRTDCMGALALVQYNRGDHEAAWNTLVLQQEVDGSADPHLKWALEAELGRTVPHFAVLGPRHLQRTSLESSQ